MKLLTFNSPRIKADGLVADKRVFITALIVVLILAILSGYFLLNKTTKTNLLATVSNFFSLSKKEKPINDLLNGQAVSVGTNSLLTGKESYEETAEAGDSITTLARRALKQYLADNKGLNLSAEKKIYIEDYMQKKTGDYWLDLGQEITFSEKLIKEAINHTQQLTPQQLNNLHQYTVLVSF